MTLSTEKKTGESPKIAATLAIFAFACAFLLSFDYGLSKLFVPMSIFSNLCRHLAPFFLLVFSAHALGVVSLRKVEGAYDSLLALALGFAIFSFVATILSILGLVHPYLLALILIVPVVLCRKDHGTLIQRGRSFFIDLASSGVVGVLAIVVLLLYLIFALSPPCWIDPLTYHLVIPKEYLANGGIPNNTVCPHSYFPPAMSMLYMYVMALGSDLAPKLLHYFFLLLLVAALFRIGRRLEGSRTASLAVLLFVGQWCVTHGVQRANVDFHYSFYASLTLFLLIELWMDGGREDGLLLAGCFLGTAMASKLTSIATLIGAESLMILFLWRKKVQLRDFISFNVAALLLFVPYLLRNFIWTGDPLCWFLSKHLNTFGVITKAQLTFMDTLAECLTPPPSISLLAAGPILAYLYGAFPTVVFDGFITPLFLVGIPLAILVLRREKWFVPVMLSLSAYYAVWILLLPRIRHLLPIMPLMALVVVAAFRRLIGMTSNPWSSMFEHMLVVVIITVVAFTEFFFVVEARYYLSHNLPAFLGVIPRRVFLQKTMAADCLMLERIMGDEEGAVFCLFESQTYYTDRPTKADSTYTNLAILKECADKGEDPILWLRNSGYRWIVFDASRIPWICNWGKGSHYLLNPTEQGISGFSKYVSFFEKELKPRLKVRYKTKRLFLYDLKRTN